MPMVKVFIDTNTLVHWMIIKKKLESSGESAIEKYKNLRQSYEFIESAITGKFENAKFYISHLTLAEMTKALVDFLVYEKMRLDGVAAIYWGRYFKDYLLSHDEFGDFHDAVIKVSNLLEDKLEVINDELFDLEYYPYFIARAGLGAHDAILLTTAIRKKINYFVTMDRDFHDLLKDRRLKNIREFFKKQNLQIVKPKKMMQILRGDYE